MLESRKSDLIWQRLPGISFCCLRVRIPSAVSLLGLGILWGRSMGLLSNLAIGLFPPISLVVAPGKLPPVERRKIRWRLLVSLGSMWTPFQPGLWSCETFLDKHYGFQNTSSWLGICHSFTWDFSWMGEEPIFVVVQQLRAAPSAFRWMKSSGISPHKKDF